jgi:hypothetical protein
MLSNWRRLILSALGATCLVVAAAGLTIYLMASHARGSTRTSAHSAPASTRLVPVLPDQPFMHQRVGLSVSRVNASTLATPAISAQAAASIALQHDVAGSVVNGSVLAQVVNLGTNNSCLCWIISIHPGSALHANSSADQRPSNFDFFVIDARTGFPYSHFSGLDPSLPAYS